MALGPLRPLTSRPLGISSAATQEAERLGWGGAFVGRDFFDAQGRACGSTMTATSGVRTPRGPERFPRPSRR